MKKLFLKRAMLSLTFAVAFIVFCFPSFGQKTLTKTSGGYSYEYVENDPLGVRIYTLKNGLKVYLSENHEAPSIYTQITVRAGGKDDPAISTGIAHYLEHMNFKGTTHLGTSDWDKEKVHLDKITALYEEYFHETDSTRRAQIYSEINYESQLAAKYAIPQEFDRAILKLGGDGLNAFTTYDFTSYINSIPSNKPEPWLKLQDDRWTNPVFRLFQTEIEAVYEEKNRGMDNADRVAFETLQAHTFKKHPYGQQTVLGSVEHLKNPSLKLMYEYYHTYYVPNNMALVLAGDFNSDEVIVMVDKYFGDWVQKDIPPRKQYKEEEIKQPDEVTITFPEKDLLDISFRLPGVLSEDKVALEMLSDILYNGNTGLIDINIMQNQLAASADASLYLQNDYGQLILEGRPNPNQAMEEVRDFLLAELEKIKKGDFDEWMIEASVNNNQITEKLQYEHNYFRASAMTQAFAQYMPWENFVGRFDKAMKLTKQDIVNVANKYFKNNYVAVFRKNGAYKAPRIIKPKIDPVKITEGVNSKFYDEIVNMPTPVVQPKFVDFKKDFTETHPNANVTIMTAPNLIHDLFSFEYKIDVGYYHFPQLKYAADYFDLTSTDKKSGTEIKNELYRLGTKFYISVNDNDTRIALTGLENNLEKSLVIVQDWLQNFIAEDAALKTYTERQIKDRQDRMKNPNEVGRALGRYLWYGENSSNWKDLPNAKLSALTAADVKSSMNDFLSYQYTVLYSGKKSSRDIQMLIDKYPLSASGTFKTPPAEIIYTPKLPEGNNIYLVDMEMVQAQIRFLQVNNPLEKKDEPFIELYTTYFGSGLGGIVFQEIREARALAYAAGAFMIAPRWTGVPNILSGFIGCQADKSPEAINVMLDIMINMPQSEEKFQSAKQNQITGYESQSLARANLLNTILEWKKKGYTDDPRREFYEASKNFTLKELMDFQASQVKNKPVVLGIVAKKEKLNTAEIEKHGKIKEIPVSDVFGYERK